MIGIFGLYGYYYILGCKLVANIRLFYNSSALKPNFLTKNVNLLSAHTKETSLADNIVNVESWIASSDNKWFVVAYLLIKFNAASISEEVIGIVKNLSE
jgi:hypothetical protein